MAHQSNDKVARLLLDPSGREVLWPLVFSGVKNIVRANSLNNDTLACIKSWLKSNDSQLHIPLLGLTVLHTISLNCSTVVRNHMAAPKLFQRMEKQLARPQGPQVATALVQLLVDWAYLFGQEELGARSQALLDQPRFRQMAAGCGPSPAVLAMQEELQVGLPPVAPIRGEDFVRWMYRGASIAERTPSLAAGNSSGGGGGTGFSDWPSVLSGGLPGGAPPPISPPAVPELCKRMQADAQRMEDALAACRAAARTQRHGELTAAMDAAYREAERCSQWRRRVQDYTQHCDDPLGLSSLLAATDVINQALQHWQHFTGREVYDTLRIAVPPPSAEMLRRTATATAGGRPPGAAAGGGGAGRGSELADLLGMGHAITSTAPAASNNPFAVSAPAVSGPAGSSAFAAAAPHPSRLPASGPPAAFDWDPFAPSPPAPPAPPPQPLARAAAPVLGGGGGGGGGGAGGNSWTAFPQDPAGGDVSCTGPQSPNPTSPQPSGPILSPSAASAVSVTSALSTPNGGGGGGSAVAATHPTATATAGSPRPPPTGLSYLQHFHDLLDLIPSAATPQQAAVTAAAAAAAAVPATATNGGGSGGSRPAAVGATASAAAAAASAAVASSAYSAAVATAAAGGPHMANGHANAYPTTGSAAATASAAAVGGGGGGGMYPRIPAAGPSLPASASAAPGAGNGGPFRIASSGDGVAAAAAAAAAPALDWQPEFDRLASDLRSLWAAASSPALSHSASSSSLAAAAAAANGGGAAATLLPAVLARVKGMCQTLAAQHARQVAALAAPSHAASFAEAATARDTSGSNGNGNSAFEKLRGVAPASASAAAAAAAGGGAATEGAGTQGAGSASGTVASPGAAGWVGFGAGGTAAAMGPLQQHLRNQQQQQQQQQHYVQQQQNYLQQQQQQQLRTNGVAAGGGRNAASRESLI
ncbi:hypothetical protein PLESTB_000654500 [Pleodorina starrii]|uniref:VHS domain-containing protein n=1 Tax=Pleodorina starrii TaxID=330485 RepID=A0A9W6BJ12_9CHLO|nr:hypothetical protein PLESTB_000654500 [Pleodorina starrii]